VSEETLRNWADAGHVRSYRTPGAHRRFAREELENLQVSELTALPDDLAALTLQRLRRRYRSPKRAQVIAATFDDESRERLRVLGRRLVEVALQYHQDRRHRPALREEARFLGAEYGAVSIRLGMALTQALTSFLEQRSFLADAVQQAIPAGASMEEALGLANDITDLVDVVAISLAHHYEEFLDPRQEEAEEVRPVGEHLSGTTHGV
jgi:excisionase family DNA binding protein